MRRRLFGAAGLLLFVLAPTAASTAGTAPEAQAALYLGELLRSTGTPAVSAAVASKGKIVFSEGVGFADLDNLVRATGSTVYNIGSVSKANTAAGSVTTAPRTSPTPKTTRTRDRSLHSRRAFGSSRTTPCSSSRVTSTSTLPTQ